MMEQIRGWLAAVVAASILLSAAQAMIPPGAIRKISSLSGGLVLLIVLVQPLLHLNVSGLTLAAAKSSGEIQQKQEEWRADSQRELASLIESKTEAYILKEAKAQGLSCAVQVTVKETESGIPSPTAVFLGCKFSPKLSEMLEQELGIPRERQEWNCADQSKN